MPLLTLLAQHGRLALVAGLLLGALLPELAIRFRPLVAPIIVVLLFLAVLRIGPSGVRVGLSGLHRAAGLALVLQLMLPLAAAALLAATGVLADPVAMGVVLALAAAPITGSANIALMVGADPAPALRQLVVGTALLPLTALPVFLVMPAFGSPVAVVRAAGELLVLVVSAGGLALALRYWRIVPGGERALMAMDGLAALFLGLVVIGLMSALGPALLTERPSLLLALLAAFTLNMAMQLAASVLAARRTPAAAPAIGIVAGNRNLALFLGVLPAGTANELLLFVGCFQIPMYLTPFILSGWYRRIGAPRAPRRNEG